MENQERVDQIVKEATDSGRTTYTTPVDSGNPGQTRIASHTAQGNDNQANAWNVELQELQKAK